MTDLEKLRNMQDANLVKSIVEVAQEKGKQYSREIKTNQIRNFYSQVEALKQKVKMDKLPPESRGSDQAPKTEPASQAVKEYTNELVMLKPRLAYAAGRQNAVKPFYEFVAPIIDYVLESKGDDRTQALNNFFLLIESIVAYHKFYGGKDK